MGLGLAAYAIRKGTNRSVGAERPRAVKLRSVRIETERLLLRPITLADLDEFVAMHAETAVARFVRSFARDQAIARIQLDRREWAERGHGLVAIVERATGRFIGRAGLRYWPQFDETEVGWVLRRDAWGRGFATEAGRACLTWGFDILPVCYLTAMIRPDNARSINVAERLGMAPLRTDVLTEVPVVVYWMKREDWRGQVSGPPPRA